MTRVYVNGTEITDRVISVSTPDALTAGAQITFTPVEITVKNRDGAYSIGTKAHIPADVLPSSVAVRVVRDMGEFVGRLVSVDAHVPGVATLTAESDIAAIMGTVVSATVIEKTPAEAVRIIAEAAGIKTGNGFNAAIAEQFAAGMLCNAVPVAGDGLTLSAVLSAIAELASMRLSIAGDTLDASVPHSAAPYWRISPGDIITSSDFARRDEVPGYSVDYLFSGNAPAIGGATKGNIWTQECGASSWLQICNNVSAHAFGHKAMMAPRWSVTVTVHASACYAAPGSVLFLDAPAIGVYAACVVAGVQEDEGWYRLTLEERRT